MRTDMSFDVNVFQFCIFLMSEYDQNERSAESYTLHRWIDFVIAENKYIKRISSTPPKYQIVVEIMCGL